MLLFRQSLTGICLSLLQESLSSAESDVSAETSPPAHMDSASHSFESAKSMFLEIKQHVI